MKNFLKLEKILTEEQLTEVKEKFKKVSSGYQKTTLIKYNASVCQCGNVASHRAIFDADGCSIVEKYCNDCISKECHIKQPEINALNFDQFFDTIPEYRQVLKQRYEELIKTE